MELNKSPFSIVCDAGPIIHLDELECLDLISDFKKIFIPDAVLEEIKLHRPQLLQNNMFSYEKVTVGNIQHLELITLISSLSLHEGEQEALNFMLTKPESILITDDSAARLAAITLKLKVHGTIGILIRAIRRNQRTLSEIIDIIRAIPSKSSLHIKPSLLDSVLDQLN
ncbi:MAG: DNA-binding protein [Spirochaetia bacterium]|jgi:predicted nucleic acid-binding protein|nr:DNA-binding protein [Spirochaetia bacterium]